MQPLSVYPLSIIPAQDAIVKVLKGRAAVIDTWDAVCRSPNLTLAVPRVIVLTEFVNIYARPKFCRRSILLRDKYRCQYCGARFKSEDLTFDHVIPKSKGGQTVWDNILSCCVPCNTKKRDSLPGQYMRPLRYPYQPRAAELLATGLEFLDTESRETWGSYLYWNTELEK